MRNPFRTRLRIGLSPGRVTLLHTGTLWRADESILADVPVRSDPQSPDAWIAALRTALAGASCKKLSAAVIVSDDWVRYFIVTPPRQATNLADCRAAAAMRFQTLYGELAATWEILADWDATHPFLACAMPARMIAALTSIAAEFQLDLVRIVPQFVAAWNRWHRGVATDAWFGNVQEARLTLAAVECGRLSSIRSQPLPAEAFIESQWLAMHVGREALRLGLTAPRRIHLCGNPPPGWLNDKQDSLACEQIDMSNKAVASAGVMLARTGMAA